MKNRIKIILITIFVSLLYSGVTDSCDENSIKVMENNTTHPVLLEIEICSPAFLELKHGQAFLRKNTHSEYIEMEKIGLVTNGNIIKMEKGSIVVLYLCDGSSFTIGPLQGSKVVQVR